MSATSDFYRARAEESNREAEAALLDNVRDRCRRSEAAWTAMAERLTRAEAMRDQQTADKIVREQEQAA
ncbi:hypothetical protein [Sphingomonas solaris]|uniref:Uncharacterized protein n=1 Tax=Alterirhizorhabdus solaris TaxID=2529389 RepID=A0A558QS61_9SPHN|nr:hypothetical protein [Sphingomonas solaris]TVV69969.1 hypothetical protein FOY91_20290 [Sphingomonas solaris]